MGLAANIFQAHGIKKYYFEFSILCILFSVYLLRAILKSHLIYISSLKKKKKQNTFFIIYLLSSDNFTHKKKGHFKSLYHFPRYLAATKKPQSCFPFLFRFQKTWPNTQFSFKTLAFTHGYTPVQLILWWMVLIQFSVKLPWVLTLLLHKKAWTCELGKK